MPRWLRKLLRLDTRVRIVYKSGHTVVVKVKDFTVQKRGAELTSAEWTNDIWPRPLFLGLDEIESVWEN